MSWPCAGLSKLEACKHPVAPAPPRAGNFPDLGLAQASQDVKRANILSLLLHHAQETCPNENARNRNTATASLYEAVHRQHGCALCESMDLQKALALSFNR
eukprot:10129179-Alexandrium_andersonii.AAC.1